jgi:LPS export ABC transporter protein LptC
MRNLFTKYFKTAAILVIATAFSFPSCSENKESEIKEVLAQDPSTTVEKAENVEFSYTDSGRLVVIIKAPKTARYHLKDKPYTEMVEGVDAQFFDKDLKVESTLRSDYAKSFDKEKLIEVRNNVVVTNVKQEKLETEKLLWDQKTKQIYTDKHVTITTKKQIITGTGLRANQNFTKWTLLKPSGTFNIEDDKQVDTIDSVDAGSSSSSN